MYKSILDYEHLLATLAKVGFEAVLNFGDLGVVLVIDATIRNLASGAQSLYCLLADMQILAHNLIIYPLLVDVACLL